MENDMARLAEAVERIAVAIERLARNNEERVELLREANRQQQVGIEVHKRGVEISEMTIPEIQDHRAVIGEMVSALRGEDKSE